MDLSVQLAINALELLISLTPNNLHLDYLGIIEITTFPISYLILKSGLVYQLFYQGGNESMSKQQLIDTLEKHSFIEMITLNSGPFEFELYHQE